MNILRLNFIFLFVVQSFIFADSIKVNTEQVNSISNKLPNSKELELLCKKHKESESHKLFKSDFNSLYNSLNKSNLIFLPLKYFNRQYNNQSINVEYVQSIYNPIDCCYYLLNCRLEWKNSTEFILYINRLCPDFCLVSFGEVFPTTIFEYKNGLLVVKNELRKTEKKYKIEQNDDTKLLNDFNVVFIAFNQIVNGFSNLETFKSQEKEFFVDKLNNDYFVFKRALINVSFCYLTSENNKNHLSILNLDDTSYESKIIIIPSSTYESLTDYKQYIKVQRRNWFRVRKNNQELKDYAKKLNSIKINSKHPLNDVLNLINDKIFVNILLQDDINLSEALNLFEKFCCENELQYIMESVYRRCYAVALKYKNKAAMNIFENRTTLLFRTMQLNEEQRYNLWYLLKTNRDYKVFLEPFCKEFNLSIDSFKFNDGKIVTVTIGEK